jgi:hypothetical protein
MPSNRHTINHPKGSSSAQYIESYLIKFWYRQAILQLYFPVQLLRRLNRFLLPHSLGFLVRRKDKVVFQERCSLLHIVLGRNFIVYLPKINDQGFFDAEDWIGRLEWITTWVESSFNTRSVTFSFQVQYLSYLCLEAQNLRG